MESLMGILDQETTMVPSEKELPTAIFGFHGDLAFQSGRLLVASEPQIRRTG